MLRGRRYQTQRQLLPGRVAPVYRRHLETLFPEPGIPCFGGVFKKTNLVINSCEQPHGLAWIDVPRLCQGLADGQQLRPGEVLTADAVSGRGSGAHRRAR